MVRLVESLILIPISVLGHGCMYFPPTRNFVTPHSCSTCANGPSVCGSGPGQWLADDTQASLLNSAYTTPLTELVAGGMVDLELNFTAAHQGHMVIELCANPGPVITNDCFVRLERDPNDTRFSPYIGSRPDIFVMPQNTCTQGFLSTKPMLARFKIPETAISEHAILRFHWQSGNSCDSHDTTFRSTATDEVLGWSNTIYGLECKASVTGMWIQCGADCPNPSCMGEQFRNCADVKIVAGDKTRVITSGTPGYVTPPTNGQQPEPGKPLPSTSSSTTTTTTTTPCIGGYCPTAPAPGPGDISAPVSAEQMNYCLATIKGLQEHLTAFCQEKCEEYGAGNSFGRIWCKASGIEDSLIDCVRKHQAAVCK